MKILVTVKRVIDPYVKIRVKTDESGVETQHVKHTMNPFDEIALEEAIRWMEKQWATEVVVVSIGTEAVQETLRHGLALGATRAIHVACDKNICSLDVAQILKKIVDQEQPNLVLMGKQAIDDDNNQTPQMLAGLLGWPQATFASRIEKAENRVTVCREVDSGSETLAFDLPGVISVDLRLNEPRYASLPNIMKAKQKPLTTISLDNLDIALTRHLHVQSVVNPPTRKAGIKVDSVQALLTQLKNAALI